MGWAVVALVFAGFVAWAVRRPSYINEPQGVYDRTEKWRRMCDRERGDQ